MPIYRRMYDINDNIKKFCHRQKRRGYSLDKKAYWKLENLARCRAEEAEAEGSCSY